MNNRQRDFAFALVIVLGYVLLHFNVAGSLGNWLIVAALAGIVVFHLNTPASEDTVTIQDPPIAGALFNTTQYSAFWLAVRIFVGLQWVEAGLHKLSDPAWMQTGEALQGFWTNIVRIPETGRPPITYDWYRGFIQGMLDAQAYTWFAKLVAIGEFAIGVALIIGILVGFAAFFGAFMNFNFMLAGSASSNPVLFFLAILLILAWKSAGYFGVDRWLLPYLGTPWSPGTMFRSKT
jgi:thiosulfate dehydrogenase (quinone) large subunit